MKNKFILKKCFVYIMVINLLFVTIIPFIYGTQSFVNGFMLSHYLALIIHNIFLGISNHIICQFIDIKDLMIQRVGYYNFFRLNIFASLFQISVYFTFFLLYGVTFFGINDVLSYQSMHLIYIYFIITNISHFILLIQILIKKNGLCLSVAIIINLCIHYFVLIPNF